jgi:caa(3)-type oxidase subunit IV
MNGAHPARTAWVVWLALLGLLTVSAASARVDLGWANSVINLGAAACKCVLIATFYMRFRRSAGAVRLAVVVTLLMFALLLGLSLTDALARR